MIFFRISGVSNNSACIWNNVLFAACMFSLFAKCVYILFAACMFSLFAKSAHFYLSDPIFLLFATLVFFILFIFLSFRYSIKSLTPLRLRQYRRKPSIQGSPTRWTARAQISFSSLRTSGMSPNRPFWLTQSMLSNFVCFGVCCQSPYLCFSFEQGS